MTEGDKRLNLMDLHLRYHIQCEIFGEGKVGRRVASLISGKPIGDIKELDKSERKVLGSIVGRFLRNHKDDIDSLSINTYYRFEDYFNDIKNYPLEEN